ncbi:MAG: hypothetical protein BM556_08955 [Bacteriovorax sp. MedPE-SWde]|nr:MAG: hypothetical protein BM556_08955 [Bacteriovorax sp. MedPE-SWde]
MKKILVSQRVSIEKSYNERRDCLDQSWMALLEKSELLPVLVPNNISIVRSLISEIQIDGVLLTGGNSLIENGGDAPERDDVELFIIKYAIDNKLPIYGVCRGMQIIQRYFGIDLFSVDGHVATRHKLKDVKGNHISYLKSLETVNAFHDFGTTETLGDLKVSARSENNIVMAIENTEKKIFGQMWHPERESPYIEADINQIKLFFGV